MYFDRYLKTVFKPVKIFLSLFKQIYIKGTVFSPKKVKFSESCLFQMILQGSSTLEKSISSIQSKCKLSANCFPSSLQSTSYYGKKSFKEECGRETDTSLWNVSGCRGMVHLQKKNSIVSAGLLLVLHLCPPLPQLLLTELTWTYLISDVSASVSELVDEFATLRVRVCVCLRGKKQTEKNR